MCVLLAACGSGPVAGPDAGAPDAAPIAQGSPPAAELAINELSPAEDWVELVNRGDQALDLADFYLSDSPDRLDHYLPLTGELAPGARVVIDLAGAPFGLGVADEVTVLSSTGLHVDGLAYLYFDAPAGDTLARRPDAEGLFYLAPASPGEVNP